MAENVSIMYRLLKYGLFTVTLFLLASCQEVAEPSPTPLLTPAPRVVDWRQGEQIAILSNTRVEIGALAIGCGNFERDAAGRKATLWIAAPDPYENRVVRVHEGDAFQVQGHTIRVDAIDSDAVVLTVISPVPLPTPDPRFEREERTHFLLPGEDDRLKKQPIKLDERYILFLLERPRVGEYVDCHNQRVRGYMARMQVREASSGQVVKEMTGHACTEFQLDSGTYVRIFYLDEYNIYFGVLRSNGDSV